MQHDLSPHALRNQHIQPRNKRGLDWAAQRVLSFDVRMQCSGSKQQKGDRNSYDRERIQRHEDREVDRMTMPNIKNMKTAQDCVADEQTDRLIDRCIAI